MATGAQKPSEMQSREDTLVGRAQVK